MRYWNAAHTVARHVFPAWFDAAAFREAFQLTSCDLPLAEVRYSVIASADSCSVDIVQEYVDDHGVYRLDILRRIRDIVATRVAEHGGFFVVDEPPHPAQRFQKRGLATGHLRSILPLYDSIGVSIIHLAATQEGRVVWPKFGFRIDPAERAAFEDELISLETRLTGFRPPRASLPLAGPDVLQYVRGEYSLGLMALRARTFWSMQLDLTDPEQRAILEAKCRR